MRYKNTKITADSLLKANFYYSRDYETREYKGETLVNVNVILEFTFLDGKRYRYVQVPKGLTDESFKKFIEYLKVEALMTSKKSIKPPEILEYYMFRLRGEYHFELVKELPKNIYFTS